VTFTAALKFVETSVAMKFVDDDDDDDGLKILLMSWLLSTRAFA